MKSTIPLLPSGVRYCTLPDGSRHCTGSQMGRGNILPPNPATARPKLRLMRLRLVDGDYDAGGAYWGNSRGTSIYRALSVLPCAWQKWFGHVELFTRAHNRDEAKAAVLALIPAATFYR